MAAEKPGRVWWTISGDALAALLLRAHDGEDPDLIMAEEYANAGHEYVEGDDDDR